MSEHPQWLSEFADKIAVCLQPLEKMPPVGCHFAYHGGTWEVSLFVSPTEVVGGQFDGERYPGLFVLDLIDVLQVFDVVESAGWQPQPINEQDELCNHVSVEGYVGGHRVWLRILADSPERYAPGRYLNVADRSFLETWS